MTTIKKIQHVIAVLKIPRSIANFISYAKSIVMAMTGNPNFTTPSPTLASVAETIRALEDAQSEAFTKATGTAEKRDVKRAALIRDLHELLRYVQGIADKNPDHAQDIILSAGMKVKQAGSGRRYNYEVRHTISGKLMLTAKTAGKHAAYDWEKSTDGKTWISLPPVLVAKTEVSGLTPGETYYFRYRSITRSGTSDWSHIISVIAL